MRAIATKYGLPSKNYVNKWETELKKKGMLPPDATKPVKTAGRAPEAVLRNDDRTERERQYELEIEAMKAQIQYYESLDYIKQFLKKTKPSEKVKLE